MDKANYLPVGVTAGTFLKLPFQNSEVSPIPFDYHLLKEDGFHLLQENGYKINL